MSLLRYRALYVSSKRSLDTARYPDSSKRKGKGKNVDRAEDIQELGLSIPRTCTYWLVIELPMIGTPEVNAFAPRQYFVLTDAGKPVFIR